MELRVIQNSVGRYNLLGSEESLSFSMAIVEEDKKAIQEGENKAVIQYSGDPDELSDFEDNIDDIGWLFEKCYGYSKRVFGSTDYQGNAELFARIFYKNFEELSKNHEQKQRERLEREIADRQKKLDNYLGLEDSREDIVLSLEKEAAKYDKWAEASEKESAEYIPGSEKGDAEKKKALEYRTKAAKIRSNLSLEDKG